MSMILAFESVSKILECDHRMKATEQCFPNVLSIFEVILIFEFLGKVIMRFSQEDSCRAILKHFNLEQNISVVIFSFARSLI